MLQADLARKTAVVTGSTSGIGREIAKMFARNGAAVVINSFCDEGAAETVDDINRSGGCAAFIPADVSDMEQTKALMDKTMERFGGIDILVNNAGVNIPVKDRGTIDVFPDEMWRKIMSVDLDGVYNCSKSALKHMKKTGGRIINIGSITGLVPLRNQCAFAAAKAAVIHLSKAMAIELADFGVNVNVICPGSIQIPIMVTDGMYTDGRYESIMSHIPMKKPGAPSDIASMALYLASEEAGYVTGAVMVVDGGWTCGFARDW